MYYGVPTDKRYQAYEQFAMYFLNGIIREMDTKDIGKCGNVHVEFMWLIMSNNKPNTTLLSDCGLWLEEMECKLESPGIKGYRVKADTNKSLLAVPLNFITIDTYVKAYDLLNLPVLRNVIINYMRNKR